jgi:ribosomal protein S18 acetylase RimI-like enzyme
VVSTVVEPSPADLCQLYVDSHQVCANQELVLSRERPVGVEELDDLWGAVGWGVLAFWRIEKALANSLLVVGLWQHDPAQPRLVGFGRCIGDGVIEAVVCDVAIHPHHQGVGLGKRLMV